MAKFLRHMAAHHAKNERRQQARYGQAGPETYQAKKPNMDKHHDPTTLMRPMHPMEKLGYDQRAPAGKDQSLPWQNLGNRDLENCPAKQNTDHEHMRCPQKDIQDAPPGRTRVVFDGICSIIIEHGYLPGLKIECQA
jgi:hypothetical protein